MPHFDKEIAAPVLPITAASSPSDVIRLQEWLVARGIDVGGNPSTPADRPAAAGIDGGFGNGTKAGCSAFATANGLASAIADAVFWQKLTGGMAAAFSFRSTRPDIGSAIMETAQIHFDQKPLEARRKNGSQWLGQDNSGPWVRAYCLGLSVEWCQGAASQWVKQAFAALGRKPPFPLDPPDVLPLFVPSIVTAARNNQRFVPANSAAVVPPGSFFFVKGMVDGRQSHTHVGVTVSAVRPDGSFDTIEGNTNAGGSVAGVEVCRRTRSRSACDFGILA
jgi:peptidoglycan hydrolase-like protein with peptidoglycan-binding domain